VVEARPGKSITHGRNPVGVDEGWGMMTQGSSCLATVGLWAKIPLGFEGGARGRAGGGTGWSLARDMAGANGSRRCGAGGQGAITVCALPPKMPPRMGLKIIIWLGFLQ
jgi:hypothetical protein